MALKALAIRDKLNRSFTILSSEPKKLKIGKLIGLNVNSTLG
jgi:hypothetical protein